MMKNRIWLVVLIVVCIGLGIALIVIKNQADKDNRTATDRIVGLSNDVVSVNAKLDDQKKVATELEEDLDTQKKAFVELTNTYTQLSSNLTQTEASLKSSLEEVAKRDSKISELEIQNQALDKQALDLSIQITNLNDQIADTQKKLTASEGNRAYLEEQLKRMTAEKAELERQFNDLSVLRAQVSKLKDELALARRMDWIRRGVYANAELKGAQRLMQGAMAPKLPTLAAQPSYDLNVEVSSDGNVRIIPPPTNAPPRSPNK